jgi:hypothetical protein
VDELSRIAWYGRHGSLRKLGQAGCGVRALEPGTTGRTRLDGMAFEKVIETVPVPVGSV